MELGVLITGQAIVSVVLSLYWIVIMVVLINDGRDPTKTLAWALFLTIFPVFGLVFYFFFGRNWKKKTAKSEWIPRVLALATPVMNELHRRYATAAQETRAWARQHDYLHLVDLIATADRAEPLPAYDVDLLINGDVKFAALKKDLAAARESINIQYFIWEHDELTASLTEILLDRLHAGVEVRMLNDFIGNIQYKKDELRQLKEAGAKVQSDVRDLGKVNYRNHRKMVIIDNVLGYTGGINVGQEYIDGGPRYASWRDSHVRFRGPAVADLQKLFSLRWHEVTGESLFNDRYFPATYPEDGRRSLAQIVSTGVESPWESARRAHVVAISSARERVWIQSPYFVPTSDIYEAMINAALSGADVRFMMTGIPDKKIAWYAAETYLAPFIEAGGTVYRYQAGFFHAKTMTVDGQMLSMGTLNLDIRSLELHKELMVWFYDSELALAHEDIFRTDMEQCEVVTSEMLASHTFAQNLRNSGARLTSNLL